MSRLIDADKLIEDITITINEWIKDMVYGEYLEGCVSFSVVAKEIVRKQPTAFDVEKVVEQLDNLRKEYKMEANNINIPHNYSCYYKGHMRGYEHSIDIVKRGVIDDNN